ncbi:MAG: 50S ribosomal protein L18 [Halobacteriovoraceae bacterium]|nr:50S ribosomal protein L18 [Halobacteriovoraceae bacterium]|tara:strand:+ start:704 stop:1078 length:375 start_codon:yes stop_codon:yes gene_type:complete
MRKNTLKIKSPKAKAAYRRKLTIRSKISGTSESPRICFSKSNRNVFIQAIDDEKHETLFSVSSFGKNAVVSEANSEAMKKLAELFVEKSKEKKLNKYVFDRSGNKFTGNIKTFVDSVRGHGILI